MNTVEIKLDRKKGEILADCRKKVCSEILFGIEIANKYLSLIRSNTVFRSMQKGNLRE